MQKRFILLAILLLSTILILSKYFNGRELNVLSVSDEKQETVFGKYITVIENIKKDREFNKLIDTTETKYGTFGIVVAPLDSDVQYIFNETELFYGASLFKIPIALATMKQVEAGNIKLEDEITYLQSDYSDGTGSINASSYGTTYTVDELLNLLLQQSDNTAQNMLTRILGYHKLEPAYSIITIKNHFYQNNTITPEQYSTLLKEFVSSDFLNSKSINTLLEKMSDTIFDDRINVGLSADTIFSHKIGNWPDTETWHDCGIAQKNDQNIVVCVMSRHTTYENFLEVTKDVGEFVELLLH